MIGVPVPFVQVRDVNMHYEVIGAGSPMILMVGAMGSIESFEGWMPLGSMFAEHYRCYFVDHRGHGRTDNPTGAISYAALAEDMAAFIRGMSLDAAIFCGMSDGAITALELGLNHGDLVSALVCVGANYYNDDLVREANQFAEVGNLSADQSERWSDAHDRDKPAGYWRELLRQNAENLAINPSYSQADLQEIATPTLLISGEDDKWANIDQMVTMKKNVAASEMLIVNHAGHNVHATHPEVVGPRILDFLRRRI